MRWQMCMHTVDSRGLHKCSSYSAGKHGVVSIFQLSRHNPTSDSWFSWSPWSFPRFGNILCCSGRDMGYEVRMPPVQILLLSASFQGVDSCPYLLTTQCTPALFPAWCGNNEALTYYLNPKQPGSMTKNSLCINSPAPLSPRWADSATCVPHWLLELPRGIRLQLPTE